LADSKRLLKHVLIYGSGVWAGKAIGFIMIPIYTRALTPSDYGVLELASRTTDIVAVMLGMGLASALFRFHAEGKSEAECDRVVNTAVTFAGVIGLIAAVFLAGAAAPISKIVFGSIRYIFYLKLALIAMVLELSTMVPMALLRIHERSGLYTAINLTRLGTALCLNIYLVVMRRMGVLGVLTSNVAGISLVLLILIIGTRHYWKPKIDSRILKGMLAYSLPLVPSSLAMFILNFGDRYFLRSCCSLKVLGIYSLGYKLCLVMPGLVMEPLGLAWSAVVFPVAARSDAERVYGRYFNVYMFCVVFFSLALAALSRDLISVMADPGYIDAWKIVPIVLLGFFAWASVNVFEIGVFLEKKTYYRTFSCLIGAAVAMGTYAYLIPRYAAMGAAWATVSSFFAMSVATYFFARKLHPIRYDLRRMALLVGMAIAVYGLTALVPGQGKVSAIALRSIAVLLFPAILYAAGYFEPENIAAAKGAVKSVLRTPAALIRSSR